MPPGPGPYHIQIGGLPSRYTWKDLKDLVRRNASHGIWVDVKYQLRDRPVGYVKLIDWNEAKTTFVGLSRTKIQSSPLYVEIWDVSFSPPRFIHRNFEPSNGRLGDPSQEIARLTQDLSHWSPGPQIAPSGAYPFERMAQYTGGSGQFPRAQQQDYSCYGAYYQDQPDFVRAQQQQAIYEQQQHQVQHQAQQQAQQQAAQQAQQQALRQQALAQQQEAVQRARVLQQSPQHPGYGRSAHGLPVNTSHGHAVMEYRSVFVSKLNFKAEEKDVRALLASAGSIVKCNVPKDSKTKKSKGRAQVEFATAEAARTAIENFDGKQFMGMTLKVRFDKDATTLVAPQTGSRSEPVIVNGAMGSRSK